MKELRQPVRIHSINKRHLLFLPTITKKVNGIFIIRLPGKKGLADFKAKWGNRANTDNWRRSAALSSTVRVMQIRNNPAIQNATQDPAD